MSIAKIKLKAAREAISKKDYSRAKDAAQSVLEYESENYNALVFLGLACFELKDDSDCEKAYSRAIQVHPDQALAWQGLSKFYERSQEWEKYSVALKKLMAISVKAAESTQCGTNLQRYIQHQRQRGTPIEIVSALRLVLPDSHLYPTLSQLPPPDPTNPTATPTQEIQAIVHNTLPILEEIIAIVEKEEDTAVSKEYQKRKTRLGSSGPELLKKEIDSEYLSQSELPYFYEQILNHPSTSDDLRRSIDAKLLRHHYRYLKALPVKDPRKSEMASKVAEIIQGVVLLKTPDELGWTLFLQSRDATEIKDYDLSTFRQFMEIFPTSPLTGVFRGYLIYNGVAEVEVDPDDDDDEVEEARLQHDPEVGFDLILEASSALNDSLLASRIVASVHLQELDYASAIEIAEKGLTQTRSFSSDMGVSLPHVTAALKTIIATSLIHFYPPKHHPRAVSIIDDVLKEFPENSACILGRAYIMRDAEQWKEASDLFIMAAQLLSDNPFEQLKAQEEAAWSHAQLRNWSEGISHLQDILQQWEDWEGRNGDCARCLWRLGKCYWAEGEVKYDEAYKSFIASLKKDSAYAPAFTSLGIYYLEATSPPDHTRASKCFQKAFELDPREADAARRLADTFADEREWDLVDVVARRTIDGEGGLDAGLKDAGDDGTSRYRPSNGWAWKAAGVVAFTRRDYPQAIQSLQVALRADPDDGATWLRLGESYGKAGRHVAALKALERAKTLLSDDWIPSYFIADVQRQLGQFGLAIQTLESIRAPDAKIGVAVSLSQIYLDMGSEELSTGFISRAELSFVGAIQLALSSLEDNRGFGTLIWKTIADALFDLSTRSSFIHPGIIHETAERVFSLTFPDKSERISALFTLNSETLSGLETLTGTQLAEVAVAAYDHRLSLEANKSASVGSFWFDLGIALHTWGFRLGASERKGEAQKAAIRCLTEAVRKNSNDDRMWTALAIAHASDSATTAQHAFVKALEIDPKSVSTWTNLGLLYLQHGDLELANEALYRAQITDPDYTVSWAGQALVASANGHEEDARLLFQHAVSLTSVLPEGDFKYSVFTFSKLKTHTKGTIASDDDLFPVFYALQRYCEHKPDDASALHLYALVCERLNLLDRAIELIGKSITILETAYEETEDVAIERQFIIAHANMGRLHFSAHDYQGSLESFESAFGLLPESDEDSEASALRSRVHYGMGLANFKSGAIEDALEMLEKAVETAEDQPEFKAQATVVLAEVMWALGTDEPKETAKNLLLECITADPENLTAINSLAAMAILTEDDSLLDAALSEILALPYDRRVELDPKRDVGYLLKQHHLAQEDRTKAFSVVQNAVFLEPSRLESRKEMARLRLQANEHKGVASILAVAPQGSNYIEELRSSAMLTVVAEAEEQTGEVKNAIRLAQKGVMISPWDTMAWKALIYARSKASV